jgi:hypothetical protein
MYFSFFVFSYFARNRFINLRAEFGTLFTKQTVGSTEIKAQKLANVKNTQTLNASYPKPV